MVEVRAAGEAGEVAALIGSPGGMLSRALVTVRRTGESETRTDTTDASGRVAFQNVLPGSYDVAVVRLLTPAEAESLAAGRAELAGVNALGGGGVKDARAPADTFHVDVVAGRRGSLVISEVMYSSMWSTSGAYRWARYLELYNNADTTVYLDGKVILKNGVPVDESVSRDRCSTLEEWRLDPNGIWSEWHVQIPGGGRNYPLQPGEAVALIATDAIDHREFWPGASNLANADFEGVGSNDVDNPAVPNLVDIGIRRWEMVLGHGWYPGEWGILAVADAVNPAGLQRDEVPGLTHPEMALIPTENILDVFVVIPDYPPDFTIQFCNPITNPLFDRAPSRLYSERTTASVHRKVLTRLPGGRLILQRTRTSANDLFSSAQSPGSVP